MDKFFSNLGKGGHKKKNDDRKNEKKNEASWQGGSGDMESIKQKNATAASRIGSGGDGSENSTGDSKNGNVFANAGAGISDALGKMDFFSKATSSRGGGQSLGGSKPGVVLPMCFDQPGPLGLEVEKSKSFRASAIIAGVVPKSHAERVGLKRGDIVCHPKSNGEREIPYDQFVSMAKSTMRPLRFDVRRIESSILSGGDARPGSGGGVSADAYARKQAVIAAAEARDAKHKATQRPISRTEKRMEPKQEQRYVNDQTNDSEETRRAVAAAKQSEKEVALKLGYNPYETKAMTSGQARTAVVAATCGDINAGVANRERETPSPGSVNKPSDPANNTPPEFEHAFSVLVTSNEDHAAVLQSLSIMRKLIHNAITKGQQGDEEASSKFRRVRLSNPKIKEAITDVQGALELMLCFGFVLSENDDDCDTYLIYPPGEKGASWLGDAKAIMQSYENNGIITEKI
ncbi:hypothetical protein ACHAXA_002763 [Cyclostephanos tholiformis]|uniref:PUB domain-containing protein n=1 Tax=Cyclostephanos tholiformis TaxID=382380 RepID=A0ABD3RFB6_9STRA